jgi:putative transposase
MNSTDNIRLWGTVRPPALKQVLQDHKVELDFSRPGKPTDNAYIESFNGRLREECLNQHWFTTLEEAREKLDAWRSEYNFRRPHSSLGNLTPSEFAQHSQATQPQNELNFSH